MSINGTVNGTAKPTIKWDAFIALTGEYLEALGIVKFPDADTEHGLASYGPLFKWVGAQKVTPAEIRAAVGRVAAQTTRPRWYEQAIEALKLEISSGRDQSFESTGTGGATGDIRVAKEMSWDCRECDGEGLTFRYVEDRVRTHFYPCYCHRCAAGQTMRDLHASKAKPGERRKILDLRDPRFQNLELECGTVDLTDPMWKVHPAYRSAVATAEMDAEAFDDPREYVSRLTSALRARIAVDREADAGGRKSTGSMLEILAAARASKVADRDVSDAQARRADQARQKWNQRPERVRPINPDSPF